MDERIDRVASALGEARALEREDPRFPRVLHELRRCPERLFVAGDLGDNDRAIAVVGTRRASDAGKEIARALGRAFASEGCLVISGAAQGIDGAAHTGALDGAESSGVARTLAVIATPLSAPYPAAHLGLLRAIVAEGGGVVTEVASGARTFRSSFLERNRIVAALARAVVVVEAPDRSGTLSTVHHALALGRPIFAVPWSPLDEHRAGGVALLVRGEARACRHAGDVLDALGWPRLLSAQEHLPEHPVATRPTLLGLGSTEARVLRAVAGGASHVDAIVESTGMPIGEVQAALLSLVLDGSLVESGGRYRPIG